MRALHRIIYADDDENDRFFFARAVESVKATVEVLELKDGAELKQHLATAPDLRNTLIISDIKMPVCNGLEALAWMREHGITEKTKVIMLTSSSVPADIERARILGAHAYFEKPTVPDALGAMLTQSFAEFENDSPAGPLRIHGNLLIET
ncbi:response regulator [Oleiharenicola lentus]|uniref:response regulator n=1 Tax=Oleiharenicola lentus TaxID=2508720 RepID=UPI003F6700B0